MHRPHESNAWRKRKGFTLIELSIVLVIIGLLAGGVLVGRDLIAAAALRAQISQIETYNQAVNTFRGKYGYMPGDIKDPEATQFGFVARGPFAGQGDGNGILEGYTLDGSNALLHTGAGASMGEAGVFWMDLSAAGLINGSFSSAKNTGSRIQTAPNFYFPSAQIGRENYIYVWSGGQPFNGSSQPPTGSDGRNYFSVSGVINIDWNNFINTFPGLSIAEAYKIDSKIDDGLPQSGRVMAMILRGGYSTWLQPPGNQYTYNYSQTGFALPARSNTVTPAWAPFGGTCYDNSATARETLINSSQQARTMHA